MKAVLLVTILALELCASEARLSQAGKASEARAALASEVTPVEKVIKLLENLSVKVEEEGKAEAAAYDKYACFCKEQADEKLYAMETSTKEISAMDSKIKELEAELTGLNGDISDLVSQVAELTAEIEKATAKREKEHAAYKVEDDDVTGAIDSMERAMGAMSQSKDNLEFVELDSPVLAPVRALLQANQKPASYKYQSNDIIATLKDLRGRFTEKKNRQDEEEFEANSVFEKRRLGMQNEKKFAERENAEKQETAAAKSEEKHDLEQQKQEEQAAKDADQSFMDELTKECETKAGLFDQRSKARSAELTALSEALGHLKGGVAENYDANKKLVGMQKAKKMTTASKAWISLAEIQQVEAEAEETARPISFVQLRGAGAALRGRGGTSSPTQRAVALLSNAASRLGSSVLSNAVLRSQALGDDHFVKIRQIIKDLVARLKEEALNEQTEKAYCDKNMKAAITKRDKKNEELEDLAGKISASEASRKKLVSEIAVLSKEISDNKKAIAEATELREEEKKDNMQTLEDAGAGKAAVDMALSVLQKFYAAAALAQQRSSATPPNAGRDGKTVGDKAPEVFSGEYGGSQSESTGVIGLLEVILADFERTETTVAEEEKDAARAFNEFKEKTDEDSEEKEKSKSDKADQVSILEDKLIDFTDQQKSAEDGLESAKADLEVLNERCVAGDESYEERVAKRKQDIEALKQAMTILDEM